MPGAAGLASTRTEPDDPIRPNILQPHQLVLPIRRAQPRRVGHPAGNRQAVCQLPVSMARVRQLHRNASAGVCVTRACGSWGKCGRRGHCAWPNATWTAAAEAAIAFSLSDGGGRSRTMMRWVSLDSDRANRREAGHWLGHYFPFYNHEGPHTCVPRCTPA